MLWLIVSVILCFVSSQTYNYEPTSSIGPNNWANSYPACSLSSGVQSPIHISMAPLDDTLAIPAFTVLNDGWVINYSYDFLYLVYILILYIFILSLDVWHGHKWQVHHIFILISLNLERFVRTLIWVTKAKIGSYNRCCTFAFIVYVYLLAITYVY